MKQVHISIRGIVGVIPPETIHSTPVVDDHLIDIRIISLTEKTTFTTVMALPEPRREEPGKRLEPIHPLLAQDETHSRTDSINPRALENPIFQYFGNPAAKNPAVLSR